MSLTLELFRITFTPDGDARDDVDRWESARTFATPDACAAWLRLEELTVPVKGSGFAAVPYEHLDPDRGDRITEYSAHCGAVVVGGAANAVECAEWLAVVGLMSRG
jgi:hypothetical protein